MTLLSIIKLILACEMGLGIIGFLMFLLSFVSCYENDRLELVSFFVIALGTGSALITALVGVGLKIFHVI